MLFALHSLRAQTETAPATPPVPVAPPIIERNVVYGEVNGQKLLLDVHLPPASQTRRPAILLVHGGGWSSGDKNELSERAAMLAAQGYVCFNINYRLVTDASNKYPAQLDDAQRAVRWIRARTATYNLDPQRVGAFGYSAGAHLVALLGTTDTRDNSDAALAPYSSRVQCVVEMSGPADLTVQWHGPPDLDTKHIIHNLMGKTFAQAPDAYRTASPLFRIDGKTTPFLIFQGSDDPIVPLDQSQRFYSALLKAKRDAKLIVFNGEGHWFNKPENWTRLNLEQNAFFARHLQP